MAAKKKTKKSKQAFDRDAVLDEAIASLEGLGYTSVQPTVLGGEPGAVATIDGKPVVLVWVPEVPGPIRPEDEELAQELGASVEGGPADYVWATSSGKANEGYFYSWRPEDECAVSALPEADQLTPATTKPRGPKGDPTSFKKLQREFDDLHEQIYAAREPVDGSNDLTAQLCKCIFLKMHSEKDPDWRPRPEGPLFVEIFDEEYIRKNGDEAVRQIKDAFELARSLSQYNITDDRGRTFEIFDQDDYIKFRRPDTYARIARILNQHQLTSPDKTGIEDDILGRAFDVMLRAKFEGKGGMGVYLTPQQVRDAMVQMVFHDILTEDPQAVIRKDPKTGKPTFHVCDPCCGSGGFLVTAMREVRKQVNKVVGLSEKQRVELLESIYAEGFEGADNANMMVQLARINLALHGDPKAKVFRVDNSLSADHFVPESFDLILTNPPFKKGGIKEKDQSELMAMYQSDIVNGRLQMSSAGLALGAKPNKKGVWSPVKSVDPAVLFIDRCLQLLKPGGRLLIVLPDGILCNSQDRYVREYLMGVKDEKTGKFIGGKAVVKAVVSLPPVTFRLSGAGAKTSFLYLQKKRPGDEQGPVFMAVADQVGFDVKQNKEVNLGPENNDLTSILEAYKKGPTQAEADAA